MHLFVRRNDWAKRETATFPNKQLTETIDRKKKYRSDNSGHFLQVLVNFTALWSLLVSTAVRDFGNGSTNVSNRSTML